MSQKRQKKQLSFAENVESLSDHELRAALKLYNISPGPITDSTRNIYRKKLANLMEENQASSPELLPPQQKASIIEEEDEDDTSDEDYNVNEEEEVDDDDDDDGDDDDDDDDDDEFDEEEEEEDLLSELQDPMSSSGANLTDISTRRNVGEPGAFANRISRGILVLVVSFFLVIFSYYLMSRSNRNLLEPLKPFKSIIILMSALTPVLYVAYKTHSYFRRQRSEENKRVCELVSGALELLQSPEIPKGLMPILHIRDTLLTPAERKTKRMSALWSKAVKFVEEHESRVKVELVNIDGEDFRAWKWIGTRNL